MRIISKRRGSGKTAQLIYIADYTKHPIVVPSERLKVHILDKSKELGCKNVEVYTEEQVIMGVHRGSGKHIMLIDDLDLFSKSIEELGILVDVATMSYGPGSVSFDDMINQLKLMKHHIAKSKFLDIINEDQKRGLKRVLKAEGLSETDKIIVACMLLIEVGFKKISSLKEELR